ncbi:MAG: hypothetical protein ACK4J0_01065 [Candidatus Anstonellaceae archaeon]
MYDIIRFKAEKEEEKKQGLELVCLESLAKKSYSIFSDLEEAKALAKKTKFIYISSYRVDEALAKIMAQNQNIFVVAISDFFLIDLNEMKKRLGYLKVALKIIKKYNVNVRFFTLAKEKFELRNRYEILFFSKYFGFDNQYLKKIEKEKFLEEKTG